MAARLRSGSRAQIERTPPSATVTLEQEWLAAGAIDRREAEQTAKVRTRRALSVVMPAAAVAALLPAIFPLTPAFSAADTLAAIVAAAVTAAVAIGIVALADRLARGLPGAG